MHTLEHTISPSLDFFSLTRTRLLGRFLLWLPNAMREQSFLAMRNSADVSSSIGFMSFFFENIVASGVLSRYCVCTTKKEGHDRKCTRGGEGGVSNYLSTPIHSSQHWQIDTIESNYIRRYSSRPARLTKIRIVEPLTPTHFEI